ncbi:helix-turn-helix domain-containing protein [Roseimicrobium sp. ORNL1]|uniref:helix-turn-helix domain-containing protein n=1 Tax=Roseimicrobium sp. ORNL1 TaxID=2711231 RepID=UPI0013E175F4|nr:helix-turn-helix domain-containing protein [Roseimicrobium sp. ORNL1]QIF00574.1 helix-turn-helix domain-containing protein [Roseimicrobium sp. ORNL1]
MSRKTPTFNLLIDRYREQLELMSIGAKCSQKVVQPARAMLLLSHGLTWKQVSQATGLSVCRVEYFRRRFVCLGPPGLVAAPPLKRTSSLAEAAPIVQQQRRLSPKQQQQQQRAA